MGHCSLEPTAWDLHYGACSLGAATWGLEHSLQPGDCSLGPWPAARGLQSVGGQRQDTKVWSASITCASRDPPTYHVTHQLIRG